MLSRRASLFVAIILCGITFVLAITAAYLASLAGM